MFKQISLALLASSIFAFSALAEMQKLGAPLGDAKPIAIATIASDPAAYDGKEVTVEGKVCGVCTMAGCWMEIEQNDARLRIKVNDGELVFPADAVGLHAKARGSVKVVEMSREQYVAWKRHEAEEMGKSFDEKSIGEGPYKIVQITGLGAEIGG